MQHQFITMRCVADENTSWLDWILLYSTDYSFRDIYMIATAAENDESTFEKAYNGLQGGQIVLKRLP